MEGPILGIDFLQIILHLFNFFILALGLYLLIYKPVLKFMDKRKSYFENLDKDAKNLKNEAIEYKNEYDSKIKNIEEEISKMKSKSVLSAQKQAEDIIKDAKSQGDQIIKDAKLTAESEKKKIISESNKAIEDMLLDKTKDELINYEGNIDSFIDAFGDDKNGKN